MQTLSGIYKGPLTIENQTVIFEGMLRGDMVVKAGASVTMVGMVSGSVFVEGSDLVITGQVRRDVMNNGGSVTVSGMVGGTVTTCKGATSILPKAMCGGFRRA